MKRDTSQPKVSQAILILFAEAERRYLRFEKKNKSLDKAWIGLGFPSIYKPATKAGLMRTFDNRETPRTRNWYVLTATGIALYRQLFPTNRSPEDVAIGHPLADNYSLVSLTARNRGAKQ